MPIVLQTKLSIPVSRSEQVSRPRLEQRLARAIDQRLTLVSAPAGFGKSTLLAKWASRLQCHVSWLSLDDGDNDPVRFWDHFLAAFQRTHPELGNTSRTWLESLNTPPIEDVLSQWLNDASALPGTFAHVFDDYHFIENPTIDRQLAFLLEHLPTNVHIVIASRSDPALPLTRWRGRGQLAEIRASDLRFTSDEISGFMNGVMRLQLSEGDLTALDEKTEGWIAGLQLAALSVRDHPDPSAFIASFAGSNHYIIDYLVEEVLAGQPDSLREFLLCTCVLERMNADLSDAMTGRSDGQSMLDRMEHENLFLIPLDDERRWYRYHHLFAEVLRQRLHTTMPGRAHDLHRRAAIWFESNGYVEESVRHALAASDERLAAEILERHAMAYVLQSEVVVVRTWLSLVSSDLILRRPRLLVVACYVLFMSGSIDEAVRLLNRGKESMGPGELSPELKGEFLVLEATLARDRNDLEATLTFAEQARRYYDVGPLWWRTVVTQNVGFIHIQNGNIADGLAAIEESALVEDRTSLYVALVSWSTLGRVRARQGLLSKALDASARARERVDSLPHPVPSICGLPYIDAGQLLAERNELDEAELLINRGLTHLLGTVEHLSLAMAYLTIAQIRAARGDFQLAFGALDEGEALLNARRVTNHDSLRLLDVWRARLMIRTGQLHGVENLLESPPFRDEVAALQQLTLARLLLARGLQEGRPGHFSEVFGVIERMMKIQSDATPWNREVIECLILCALARAATHESQGAHSNLQRALRLAVPEGFVRIFVDEGEPMRRLLSDFCSQTPDSRRPSPSQDAAGLSAYARRLLSAFPSPEAEPFLRSAQLPEQISEREHEVLLLIARGLSNQQIAAELVVSVSTVKTHINNLYGKIGARSRTQALAKGRQLGIIER